ncbi:translocation and assembly module lipoprotein TamL [Arsenicibacter rosenii]|uniref:Outer membrane protein assembly factor n=1 Tax=Arsenicibacter rosenii TaxID=1750698 RepID=A0A1S2VQN3_9BACT|nr:BamA/TamA family outer membrane protein [Arsenicibacter rosenii]OIN61093.1 outer membrane protein assembly factor [Arsenicibacter rosenii]
MVFSKRWLVVFTAITTLVSGCISNRSVRNGEYLLYGQTIRGNRSIPTEELEALLPQKPNRRILRLPVTPALWFYELGLKSYNREAAVKELEAKTTEFEQQSQQLTNDPKALKKLNRRFGRKAKKLRRTIEEGNGLMRNLGEPPSYFYPRDGQANAVKIQKYLFNNGFFNAYVTYTLDTLLRRQVQVTYQINERSGFYNRNVDFEAEDPVVDSIIKRAKADAYVKTGERYNTDKALSERVRIETLLRNNGYYGFSRQYVFPEPDTSVVISRDSARRQVDWLFRIVNPVGQPAHPRFTIGQVQVTINDNPNAVNTPAPKTDSLRGSSSDVRNGVRFYYSGPKYATRLLSTKIRLRPGNQFRQEDLAETQRQLFMLNQYKYISVNITDTTNRKLRANITLSPLDKYETTFEGGLFVLYQNQGFPGPFGNVSFRVRNLFNGLEALETNFRYGLEAQAGYPGADNILMATEVALNSSLLFPQVLFPGKPRFIFSHYTPRTQVGIGFTFTSRPDYLRRTFRATMSYNWQLSQTRQFTFYIADVNLINSSFANREFGQAYRNFIVAQARSGNTILANSFYPAFSSNISFAYTYNANAATLNRRTNFFRTALESGGTTLNFVKNKTIEHWSDSSVTGLQFYKYLRLNLDYRRYIPIRPHTTLAFRINTGILYGYGPNKTAPYERRFFVGGSNSVRGWLPRRLGPGSALPETDETNPNVPKYRYTKDSTERYEQFAYRFEQPGDLLLEGSAELRHRLFHFGADINGALFVDAGNVWLLRPNPNKPLATLKANRFFSDMAVATGYGIRIDFSYFIIRFDAAVKVWDPARRYVNPETNQWVDERFILPKFSLRQLSKGPNPLVVNFGIGYPF